MENFTEDTLTDKLSLIVGCILMKNITPEELYQIIGKNVAKYRKAKEMSQLDLSLKMGYKSVSVVSGSEVCYKNKHFNLEQLLKIAQILEVDLCDFFTIES